MLRKISFIFFIFVLISILSACTGGEQSTSSVDSSLAESSSSTGDISLEESEKSEISQVTEESEVNESSNDSQLSEEVSEESSENSFSYEESSSEEQSELQSEEPSQTFSEDTSEEISEIPSEPTSEESSEDVSYEYDDIEIPKEFEHLESAKALESMSKSLKDDFCLELACESKVSGTSLSISVKMWGDPKKGASLSKSSVSSNGMTIFYEEKLTIGGKTYSINHADKTCTLVEDEDTAIENLFKLSSASEVETKNELVGLEIYSVDWFTLEDGSALGIYVKDGAVKYIAIRQNVSGSITELLFKLTLTKDISNVDFSLPKNYTVVEK